MTSRDKKVKRTGGTGPKAAGGHTRQQDGPACGHTAGHTLENLLEISESMIRHCAVAVFAIDRAHRVIH